MFEFCGEFSLLLHSFAKASFIKKEKKKAFFHFGELRDQNYLVFYLDNSNI